MMRAMDMTARHKHTVMAGLVPAIQALGARSKNVDARDKTGHDEAERAVP
jgi:hypothetical protein